MPPSFPQVQIAPGSGQPTYPQVQIVDASGNVITSFATTGAVDVRTFGASPTASAATNTTAIQNAINFAIANNLPLFIKDIYPVNAGLTWNANACNIFGVSALTSGLSVTSSQSIASSVLSVGNGSGASGTNFFNGSSISDIGIYGDTTANSVTAWSGSLSGSTVTNYNCGLLMNGMLNCEIRNVIVRKFPLGFNLTNNCYSCSFYNCKTFSGECYIGIYLADTVSFGAGNDMTFVNCWFTAWLCAVWIGANGGGYHFFGGQLAAGNGSTTTTADLLGVVTCNAQLQNPTTVAGQVENVEFTGVSFEGPNNIWVYRNLFPGSSVSFRNCGFLSDNNSIGIFKSGSGSQNFGFNEKLSFSGCRFGGTATTWTSAYPIVWGNGGGSGVGPGGNCEFFEEGTTGFAQGFSGINSGASTDMTTVGIIGGSQISVSSVCFSGTANSFSNGLFPGNLTAVGKAGFFSGVGVPSFSAPNSSLYLRYDGGTTVHWYINTSGASTSGTTWTAVALP